LASTAYLGGSLIEGTPAQSMRKQNILSRDVLISQLLVGIQFASPQISDVLLNQAGVREAAEKLADRLIAAKEDPHRIEFGQRHAAVR